MSPHRSPSRSGNTLEAMCGAWLVNRFAGGTTVFDRPQGVVKFALAAVVSTVIGPAFGVTSLALAGFGGLGEFSRDPADVVAGRHNGRSSDRSIHYSLEHPTKAALEQEGSG